MPEIVEEDVKAIEGIIERMSRREITEEDAMAQLEPLWRKTFHEPLSRRVWREIFPALSRRKLA
jgi:hypothetical protein